MIVRPFAGAVLLFTLLAPAVAQAEDLPSLKAGLWELTVLSSSTPAPVGSYRQCTDGIINLELLVRATGGACDLKWKRVGGDRIETETNCKLGMISAKGKGSITGDFNSKLRIETSTSISMNDLPAGAPKIALPNQDQSTVMEVRWIGPCEPGQQPGDFIEPDGKITHMPVAPRR